MKNIILCIMFMLVLVGCTSEVKSDTNKWEGWSSEASYLAKHYDKQLGVVCYISTRHTAYQQGAASLSCVKL